ncbi:MULTISPECIES: hypothetical protein [unclassified Marinitoga]|uniref:hypothetical protein n=1 Tax=unclassified Marinitoga TaxID=2640159 RepID=UPI00064177C4|nr:MULTISPECIES: hypothetical protein [unclassified Marinitoga]KLO21389.1 hypothetical protein X274_10410 [Marinitoga sp. 1155]NUU99826.1 hypothetical protein [Marinitoga sp. 1154]
MKNIIDTIIEKLLFKRIKNIFYKNYNEPIYDDNCFYVINYGEISLNIFKLNQLFTLINQFKNSRKFKNKVGILTVNIFSKKYIKYISEIAEIFGIPIVFLYKKDLYFIRENIIKKIYNNSIIYINTIKTYFLNNPSDFLYQLMDIRLENPEFLSINNIFCNLEKHELNSISSALSLYLLSFENDKIVIYKPENNNSVEYKLKEHFILKFNLKNLSKIKNGITKFDKKKIEVLLKYI